MKAKLEPLRIGIEAQRIFRKNKHGIDIVTVELIKNLQKIDSFNKYFIFVKNDEDSSTIKETNNFKIVNIKGYPYPIWEQIILPRVAKKYNLDLIHFTGNTAPLWIRTPIVLTLHDVIFFEKVYFLRGSAYQISGNIYRKLIVPRIVKKCKVIGTVSNFEKGRINSELKIPENILRTIYNGVGVHFKEKTEEKKRLVRLKYGLEGKYFFAMGSKAPRKNIINIIIGFAHYADINKEVQLLISDTDKTDIDTILNNNSLSHISNRIVTTGYISNAELPEIYSAASVFIFPSFRESFGIPVLEAMSCGTPVVTSNRSSMPEVTGDSAIHIDPENPFQISEALSNLMTDQDLYKDLSEKGIKRASQFTWKSTAEKWLEIYMEVI